GQWDGDHDVLRLTGIQWLNNSTPTTSFPYTERGIEPEPMPALDTHIHASLDARTARASLDRINRAKEHWRAYVQGRAESELMRNKMAILLSAWQAEDRARRSSRARPVVCSDCRARHLEHFYTARVGGSTLCAGCFQSRVKRGVVQEADAHHR
ncbi:hypothetical protein MYX04_13640, partial [Nitrospiraceae bacterium AH_259_D15_M11_P09]|nr:hypothetical protein [Nitrospiraceae bacterium AH_259_D15_M11_P09]